MFTHYRFTLETCDPGKRAWEMTSHTTSHWPSVPKMLEDQVKLHPEKEWRIVGVLVTADDNGQPIHPEEE